MGLDVMFVIKYTLVSRRDKIVIPTISQRCKYPDINMICGKFFTSFSAKEIKNQNNNKVKAFEFLIISSKSKIKLG